MPPSTEDPRSGERIAKLLARAGVASRREVERMIEEGRVARDGVPLTTPATVLASLEGVTVDGDPVAAPAPARLFLYHKPTGLLVTERDPRGRPTIYDRLPADLPRVVPVGRLDLNTEGLLLLTTDGGFKRQLELPATGVERAYRARAYGNVTQAQLEALIEGVEIDGVRYGSIDANLERRTGANVWVELVLTEGKNREVRRVLEHLGLQVSRLIRTRYGPFVLGDLPPGEVGEVRQADLYNFRRTLKGGAPTDPIAAEPRPGFRQAPTTNRTRRALSPPPQGEGDRAAKPRGGGGSATRGTSRPAGHPDKGQGAVATRSAGALPHPGVGRGPGVGRSTAAPKPHPGEGRGSISAKPTRQTERRTSPSRTARQSRTGEDRERGQQRSDRTKAQPDPGLRRGGVPEPAGSPATPESTPHPPRPQRKAGWAKPKPKSGPARPRKPRA